MENSESPQAETQAATQSGGARQAPAGAGRPSWRRRQYVINPSFQWKMVSWGALLTSALMICVYFYDLFLFRSMEESAIGSGIMTSDQWNTLLGDFELKRAVWFSLFILVVFLIVISFYVLMSHRIAGPIYRTVKFLSDQDEQPVSASPTVTTSEGGPQAPAVSPAPSGFGSQLRFRKKDFFPELAAAVNKKLGGGNPPQS